MRTLAHISDLHFGKEEPEIAEGLLRDLQAAAPHLVVVSGDLTQRARAHEFAAARLYLDRLPAPWLSVPGNHDIPFFLSPRRFTAPFEAYKRAISADLDPLYTDVEVAVLGLNTANALAFKGGGLSAAQALSIRERLGPIHEAIFKVVVTHHPFVPGPGPVLRDLEASGVDLLLAGHMHRTSSGDLKAHYPAARSILVGQCGTSISRRIRGEPNSYNLIRIERERVSIDARTWSGGSVGFVAAAHAEYRREAGAWVLTAT